MSTVYLVITVLFALMVTLSGTAKVRRDPLVLKGVHEVVGVPLKLFPLLALCEFAGAVGLIAGFWWPALGVAAAIGLVLDFVGAVVSHVRVGDFNGIWSALFMLVVAGVTLAGRVLMM